MSIPGGAGTQLTLGLISDTWGVLRPGSGEDTSATHPLPGLEGSVALKMCQVSVKEPFHNPGFPTEWMRKHFGTPIALLLYAGDYPA